MKNFLIFICRSVVDVRWPVGKKIMRRAKMVVAKSADITVSGRDTPFKLTFWKGGVLFFDHKAPERISVSKIDSLYLN